MNVRFRDNQDTPERDKKIKEALPKQTLISTILEPAIESRMFDVIAECIKSELEVYRKYPKKEKVEEKKEQMEETFDPRNNGTCFMGNAFKANDHVVDAELIKYRRAIGTIIHPIWGDCTLLEIWGGDHFEEHNDMVTGAFRYGMNLSDECPEIKVYVNPLFQNKKSKTFHLTEEQQQYKDDMEMLLAKAIVFGVREPKEARRIRNKRR